MSRIIGRTNEVYSDEVPEIIFLQVIDASTRSIVVASRVDRRQPLILSCRVDLSQIKAPASPPLGLRATLSRGPRPAAAGSLDLQSGQPNRGPTRTSPSAAAAVQHRLAVATRLDEHFPIRNRLAGRRRAERASRRRHLTEESFYPGRTEEKQSCVVGIDVEEWPMPRGE